MALIRGRLAVLALALLIGGCIPNQEYQPPEAPPPPDRSEGRAPERLVPPDFGPDRGDDGDRAAPLPPPRQPWEMRAVTPDAQIVTDSDYVVQPGDTLRGVSAVTGAGSEAIARANGLAPPFTIVVGERLKIPGGRYHLVHAGETGIAIARAYGVPWSQIVDANELVEPYVLRAGMRLLIPDGGSATVGPPPLELGSANSAKTDRSLGLIIDDIVTGGEPAITPGERPTRGTTSPTRLLPPDAPIPTPGHFNGAFAWPVNGTVVKRFGRGSTGERNDGIKIAVPLDTPVKAAADGVVAYTGDGVAGLGGLIIIKHGDGWTTVYGHAARVLVQRGQSVKRGQVIARSGETGFADRPELHFELRKGRTPVDPLSELPSH